MSTPEHTANSSEPPAIPPPSDDAAPTPAPVEGGTELQVGPSPARLATGAAVRVPGYEILGELGRGGMGIVYLAKNVLMNRLEVLKVVNKALLDKPGVAQRFLREIRSAAKLNHANVVKAYSTLQVGDLLVFAMEYIEGEDLAKVVKQQGPLPVAHACQYVSQAAMGLQHAHEQQMVHRDIKPHNLILSRCGDEYVVKVLDFGLAKATREGEAVTDLTGEGAMLGTPAYMAPEQVQDAANADIRADVYSLGCTLYFLLTGAPPFPDKNLYAILHAHMSTEATSLSQLRAEAPAELEAVAAKMMAKDPARRYQTPIEVAHALAPFIQAGAPADAAGADKAEAHKAGGQAPVAPSIFNRPTPITEGATIIPAMTNATAGRARPAAKKGAKKWWIAAAAGVVVLLLAAAIGMWAGGVFRGKAPEDNPVDPFATAEAKRLQQACADSLGVPVVREVDLGGGVVMKLALIPPGSFLMGAPDSELDALDFEKPQHQVTITKPFYLGMYPVTQEEYMCVTGLKNPSAFSMGGSNELDVQGLDTAKFPVEEVSWDDAAAFCEALNRKDAKRPAGWKYALPTAAQWEYACRAGTTTAYFFGGDPKQLGDYAWYNGNSGPRTHEVGTRMPNPWGLYDMGGNVQQWCQDYYGPYKSGHVIDPQGDNSGKERVLRGGSWSHIPGRCRSAYGFWYAPGRSYANVGCRVALCLD